MTSQNRMYLNLFCPNRFFTPNDVELMCGGSCQVSCRYRLGFRSYSGKNRGGGGRDKPPGGYGLKFKHGFVTSFNNSHHILLLQYIMAHKFWLFCYSKVHSSQPSFLSMKQVTSHQSPSEKWPLRSMPLFFLHNCWLWDQIFYKRGHCWCFD